LGTGVIFSLLFKQLWKKGEKKGVMKKGVTEKSVILAQMHF